MWSSYSQTLPETSYIMVSLEERLELINSLASQTQLPPYINRTTSPTVTPIVPKAKTIRFNQKIIINKKHNEERRLSNYQDDKHNNAKIIENHKIL